MPTTSVSGHEDGNSTLLPRSTQILSTALCYQGPHKYCPQNFAPKVHTITVHRTLLPRSTQILSTALCSQGPHKCCLQHFAPKVHTNTVHTTRRHDPQCSIPRKQKRNVLTSQHSTIYELVVRFRLRLPLA